MNQIFLHLIPLPMVVKGVTIPDEDGNYIIIINEYLEPTTRRQVLDHELNHIRMSHFSDILTVEDAEKSAG